MSTRFTRDEERLLKRVFTKRIGDLKNAISTIENNSRTDELAQTRVDMIDKNRAEIRNLMELEKKILEL